ncbi:hypothetical protein [Sphingomonas sp. LaA6.9]|uniref:hypothetical protein n=1 Tax=Sphingomonas sp. LaA6.9 TaxID=2919914 RepID=UPI001F4FA0D0|nr:hypothetical protein [Sphingomonas sp. LaA6.9]MCJ8155939.1 hypothetical protein [Sphingomonas sp. LaA6.9]
MPSLKPLFVCTALLALSACAGQENEIKEGGIAAVRSACPGVGVPAHAGDITLFNPATSRDASAIDVVAAITNVRTTCDDAGAEIVANATFDVIATRSNASGAREVVLPYFSTVLRGGRAVVSKRLGRIAVRFEDGQTRAQTSGAASASINRAAATLPEDIEQRLTRRRKAGDADAAIDPMSIPEVRDAVSRATFELLVGFQLTSEQLQYNATR